MNSCSLWTIMRQWAGESRSRTANAAVRIARRQKPTLAWESMAPRPAISERSKTRRACVAGGTAGKPDSNSEDGAQADKPMEAAKPPELRPTYGAFSERVLLPAGMDREAMRATYEDGLLVVTMPRKRADEMKRQKINIG